MRVRVASAGTGKTTSLVARYLTLVAEGVPLRRTAGATFTRAAAGELHQRVSAGLTELLETGSYLSLVMLSEGTRARFEEAERELTGAVITTINGLMGGMLRLCAPLVGLDPGFTVLDEAEAAAIFEEEFNSLEPGRVSGEELSDALWLFGRRALVGAFSTPEAGLERLLDRYGRALASYHTRLGGRRLGPAEVEQRAVKLLENKDALQRIRQRHQYLLLDEYQDVNPLQGSFFEGLERRAGVRIEVVGDPKQAIYSFRHADVAVFRRALATGEVDEPLTGTRRHARGLTEFLNEATGAMAAAGLGFDESEAPRVTPAGSQAEAAGSVQVHWVTGGAQVADLRKFEARLLCQRLLAAHSDLAVPWHHMAVLARSHASLELLQPYLREAGVPAIIMRGKDYFSRPEIRDIANAIRTGIDASGPAFGAWLRSPFAQLSLEEAQQVLLASDPVEALSAIDKALAVSLGRLRSLVLEPPVHALKTLLREDLARGRPFTALLDEREKANVDALLLRVSRLDPGSLELLLNELDRYARSGISEVPQSGSGVVLATIHNSKGLEWPLTALFDAGRGAPPQRDTLLIDRSTGEVYGSGSKEASDLLREERGRVEEELARLFYVAVSRPRDHLIITGSHRDRSPRGAGPFTRILNEVGYGPESEAATRHPFEAERARPARGTAESRVPLESAEWTGLAITSGPYPPLQSPSGLYGRLQSPGTVVDADSQEPLSAGAAVADPETVHSRGTILGTLVHEAIAYDWTRHGESRSPALNMLLTMFPLDDGERASIAREAADLLDGYARMLGRELPPLSERLSDESELPIALQLGGTVWHGTVDRLYNAGGEWWLDDYKTDRVVEPELYLGQMAIYTRAVALIRGVIPRVRLVYVRSAQVIELAPDVLEASLGQLGLSD